jgi:hypothetical protein
MIKRFVVYGERCSGTTIMSNLMKTNFDLEEEPRQYGWKHFFANQNYDNTDDVLFIGVVRHPIQWLCSLKKNPYHLSKNLTKGDWRSFLLNEYSSYYDNNRGEKSEVRNSRHIHTGEKYKNLFELRKVKAEYFLDHLPNLVKNFILINQEDLEKDLQGTMKKIQTQFNLNKKSSGDKFVGTQFYKGNQKQGKYKPKQYKVDNETLKIIMDNLDLEVESRLRYNL